MGGVECLTASKRRWAMLCILLGLGLSSLGSAIANIALPNISRSFASSDAATVWVVNAYQLSATVCLFARCKSGQITRSEERVYAAGLAIFVLASLGCAFAPTLPMLVSARLIQGAGAAGVAVTGVAFVRVIYPHRMVSKGVAFVALAVAIPGALGPTIAATILAVAKWPWLFLVNVPFGLAVPLFIAAAPPDLRVARPLDLTGTALNALAFGLFVVGVGTLGIGDGRIATGEIVAGLVCFSLLVRQQLQHPMPMLPFDLFRIPLFTLSVWTSVCSFITAVTAPVAGRLTIRRRLCAADKHSFRQAPAELGVWESAISVASKNWKMKSGLLLFIRHPGGVTLTNAGNKFLNTLARQIGRIEYALKDAGATGHGEVGVVQIGIFSSLTSGFLADLLQCYQARNPFVVLQLRRGWSSRARCRRPASSARMPHFSRANLPPTAARLLVGRAGFCCPPALIAGCCRRASSPARRCSPASASASRCSGAMTIRKCRSITSVDGPASDLMSSVFPTARNRPSRTATAFATLNSASAVMNVPLMKIAWG